MILVLTAADDAHADVIVPQLEQRGARVVRFDPGDVPAHAALSVEYSAHGKARRPLNVGDAVLDLNAVQSVWYRRPPPPRPAAAITDPISRAVVAEECHV